MTMWQFFALNNFTKSTGTIKNMVTHCADPLKNGTGMKSTGNYSSAWESLITSTFFPRFSPWDMEFSPHQTVFRYFRFSNGRRSVA